MTQNMINETIENTTPLKIVVVGHVDDGKSTLIGRLLYETNSFLDGKLEELETISKKRNMPMEWSFLLDAFQAERDQAITIDTTQILLNLQERNILIIDAPGHIEFLKNMVSGAADADAAFLLVDATRGIQQQTRRHAYFLNFLGIQQVVVIINKMDLIDFSESRFKQVSSELTSHLKELGMTPQALIPVSARHGNNLVTHSKEMEWYNGPTVIEAIKSFSTYGVSISDPLRIPVQDVYKFDERRIIAGRIESGTLKVGDEILFSPSHQIAKVLSIESWNTPTLLEVNTGSSVGITLDRQLFTERGDVISHVNNPPTLTSLFKSTLFWLGHHPFEEGKTYKMKLSTKETLVTVKVIESQIDTDLLQKNKASYLEKGQCGEVVLQARDLVSLDNYQTLRHTGRFVLVDGEEIVAGGMVSTKDYLGQSQEDIRKTLNLTAVAHHVTSTERQYLYGHKGGVLWFTGLSGAGKSTLAMKMEHLLFQKGYQVYVLDGDNIRSGLNSNLGFSPEDRTENIRRIGEVATLFADAGFICISAFISPYQIDRENVRKIVPEGHFHEIYIKANLQTCEIRDPKELYKKAREGKISSFTGISAPYEKPVQPDLVIDTENLDIDQCVTQLLFYVKQHFSLHLDSHADDIAGPPQKGINQ